MLAWHRSTDCVRRAAKTVERASSGSCCLLYSEPKSFCTEYMEPRERDGGNTGTRTRVQGLKARHPPLICYAATDDTDSERGGAVAALLAARGSYDNRRLLAAWATRNEGFEYLHLSLMGKANNYTHGSQSGHVTGHVSGYIPPVLAAR